MRHTCEICGTDKDVHNRDPKYRFFLCGQCNGVRKQSCLSITEIKRILRRAKIQNKSPIELIIKHLEKTQKDPRTSTNDQKIIEQALIIMNAKLKDATNQPTTTNNN